MPAKRTRSRSTDILRTDSRVPDLDPPETNTIFTDPPIPDAPVAEPFVAEPFVTEPFVTEPLEAEEAVPPITATGQPTSTMPATYDMRKILSFLSIVGVVVVISALGAFLISSAADKTYTAEAQIVVTAGLGVDPNGDVLTAPRIGQTYATLAMTRPVLLDVSKQARLPYDPLELARHIRVSADPVSPFISITATDGIPTRAQQMANALADILVEKATIDSTPDQGEQAILEIVERAIVPDEPSGPRVLLNTILAATAAFVLALAGVAVVAYFGGDRLYRPAPPE